MTNNKDNFRVWLPPLFFFFGVFFLLLTLQEGCYQKSVRLTATVTAKEYSPGTGRIGSMPLSSTSRHYLRYRFTTPQGETKEGLGIVLLQNWSKIQKGDLINIEYLPATGDSRIAGQTASGSVFLIIAIIFFGAGLAFRKRAVAIIFLMMLTTSPILAEDECKREDADSCPCGEMPVCVISHHPQGLFSGMFWSNISSNWEGFGQDRDDYLKAIYIESQVGVALQKYMPCIEPVFLNSYATVVGAVLDEAAESGLIEKIEEAKASGDSTKLAELQKEVDRLHEESGIGDFPWRHPNVAAEQLKSMYLACSTGMIELSGTSGPDGFTVNMDVSSPMSKMEEQNSSVTSNTPEGGIDQLAQKAAEALKVAQRSLFCSCEIVTERCVGTNFELSSQESECTKSRNCCGVFTEEPAEKLKGLYMGETRKQEPKCCSPIARLRDGENLGDASEEERDILNEIWCPGTWVLKGGDFDCDGVPNAKDETPIPTEDKP